MTQSIVATQNPKGGSMRSLIVLFSCAFLACAQQSEPLRQVGAVALPGVQGRIDHLSVDLNNQRLFVAALGNNTIEIIDLKTSKRIHSIPGLAEPQGVLYVPPVSRLYVANAGDGSLRIFDGSSFQLLKSIAFEDDADTLRYDSGDNQVWVGYGSGALGAIEKDRRHRSQDEICYDVMGHGRTAGELSDGSR